MLERLQERAERIGIQAVARAKRRIIAELDEPGTSAAEADGRIVLSGRRLTERVRWVGGLFR